VAASLLAACSDSGGDTGQISVAVTDSPVDVADAVVVQFTGVDGRTDGVSLADAQASEYFLAYEWEGENLPVSHGFPVRPACRHPRRGLGQVADGDQY
jgi:hypothetical protein